MLKGGDGISAVFSTAKHRILWEWSYLIKLLMLRGKDHLVYMQSQIMGHRSEVTEQIKKDQQKSPGNTVS